MTGPLVGLVVVAAILGAAIFLAILDWKGRKKGNVGGSKFLARTAVILFLVAFVGGVAMTLLSGVRSERPADGSPEIDHLKEVVARDPSDVASRERLGHLYLKMQDYENLFQITHETLQIDPNSVESKIHMGMVLFAMQKPDDAVAQCDQALAIAPNNLEALAFKGLIQLQGQNRPKEAKKTWDKYLKQAKPGDVGWGMVNSLIATLR